MHDSIVYSIFIIFTGTVIFSTIALFTRQSLLVAYLLLGVVLGPSALKWVGDTQVLNNIGEVGILFLLFLLGLHLHPQDLWHVLRKATLVTIASALVLGGVGFGVGWFSGFSPIECWVIGSAMMFSSTIIGLKLLPSTVSYHKHIGELMISILLLQDLIAIVMMLLLHAVGLGNGFQWSDILILLTLPGMLIFAFTVERYVIEKLMKRFGEVHEYIFLLAIGWCLGMAELGKWMGLSSGIGAFIGGISIATTSPIAVYIANHLKPLRDFFLVMFFFSVGANFDWHWLPSIMGPASVLAGLTLIGKPWLFGILLERMGEKQSIAREIGVRLGQASEFSLLLAYMAVQFVPPLISRRTDALIQAMTMLTFMISSYWVVLKYPTPMGMTKKMVKE